MPGAMPMPMVFFPMHMNWQISFTLPASANLTDTPLFVNEAVAMMAEQANGHIAYQPVMDIENLELERYDADHTCMGYFSRPLVPPGEREVPPA